MEGFSTNAEEIRYYIRELLDSDGAPHSRTELFEYVRKHAPNGKIFTTGMLTGAIYTLTDDPGYINLRRGWYQAANGVNQNSNSRCAIDNPIDILKNTKEELRQLTVLPLVDATEKDFFRAKQIRKIIEKLDQIIDEYQV